jgi:hypothetical protein
MWERKLRRNEREIKLSKWVDADSGRSSAVVAKQLTELRREMYGPKQPEIKRSTIDKAMKANDIRLFVNNRDEIRWAHCLKPVFGFKG